MKSPFVGCLLLSLAMSLAQTVPTPPSPPPPQQAPVNPNAPEMNTREDTTASFKAHVNLVSVPVVARDLHGVAVGDLTKANFLLFDKGKPQEITRFSVEKVGSEVPLEIHPAPGDPSSPAQETEHRVVVPERFVAYLFDDVHLAVNDLPRIRDAALRHIATLKPTDRAAIFTMSGNPTLDFTGDQDRLRDALSRLRPNIMARAGAMSGGETLTFGSLNVIKDVIQRMASAPGQRTIMVISPGFMTMDPLYFPDKTEILDRAIRANVIISAMDARGLYTDPALDVSRTSAPRGGPGSSLIRASMQADILAEMASGTGGSFFQNSNDYDEGFKRLAAAPEYIYLLGFTPQNLKNDGSFHALRVTLKPSNNLNVQARRGYYAPKRLEDAEETAHQEIEAALFSREELQELPIELHTQFFKSDAFNAQLAVRVRLDLKLFRYRKADGRNNNTVTLVTGIFDRDGNYLQGIKKVLELHLKDETLANRLGQPATIRTNFDVRPGTYLVRQVVRDSEGQLMSATNAAVQIP
jgi:VWFA-related protein